MRLELLKIEGQRRNWPLTRNQGALKRLHPDFVPLEQTKTGPNDIAR